MTDHVKLTVLLPADLAAFVHELAEHKGYLAPSLVVIDALELLRNKEQLRQERLASIRARIAEADNEQEPPLSDEEVEQYFAAKLARSLAATGENA